MAWINVALLLLSFSYVFKTDQSIYSAFNKNREEFISKPVGKIKQPLVKNLKHKLSLFEKNNKKDFSKYRVKTYSYVKKVNLTSNKKKIRSVAPPFAKLLSKIKERKEKINSEIEISFNYISKNYKKEKPLNSPVFHYFHDLSKKVYGEASSLVLSHFISEEKASFRGKITSENSVDISFNVGLIKGEKNNLEVPLIERDVFNNILEGRERKSYGGFFLIDISEIILDVEIDSDLDEKIYLNENFEKVSLNDDYQYILLSGVDPGNRTMNYKLLDGRWVKKTITIAQEEIFYDFFEYEEYLKINFQTYERYILTNESEKIDLTLNQITYIGEDTQVRKIKNAEYLFEVPIKGEFDRHYFNINHFKNSFIYGISGDRKIDIPSLDYQNVILNTLDLDESLEGTCLTEVNFSKPVLGFNVDGYSHNGRAYFETYYFSGNGKMSQEFLSKLNKVILLGEEEGSFNIKVEYTDGTIDFLDTFCSEGTYLIEYF